MPGGGWSVSGLCSVEGDRLKSAPARSALPPSMAGGSILRQDEVRLPGAAQAATANDRAKSRCARPGLGQDLAGDVGATSAAAGAAGAHGQFFERIDTPRSCFADGRIGYSIADTHVHRQNPWGTGAIQMQMRMIVNNLGAARASHRENAGSGSRSVPVCDSTREILQNASASGCRWRRACS